MQMNEFTNEKIVKLFTLLFMPEIKVNRFFFINPIENTNRKYQIHYESFFML